MSEEPIRPLEAFTPFSPDEIGLLERYAARTRALFESPFIQREMTTWSLRGLRRGPVASTMAVAEESEVRDALMLLRPLHLQSEEAGFPKVQAMVKRHAYDKGTDEGRRAIQMVKTFMAGLKTILSDPDLLDLREERVDGAGNVHTENVTPERVFDDFLYGRYFKENEERIRRIGEGLPADAQRFVFLGTVRRVAHVYTTFAGLPVSILREPALRAPAEQ